MGWGGNPWRNVKQAVLLVHCYCEYADFKKKNRSLSNSKLPFLQILVGIREKKTQNVAPI